MNNVKQKAMTLSEPYPLHWNEVFGTLRTLVQIVIYYIIYI